MMTCLHGEVVSHQVGYDVCLECGQRVLAASRYLPRGTKFYAKYPIDGPQVVRLAD